MSSQWSRTHPISTVRSYRAPMWLIDCRGLHRSHNGSFGVLLASRKVSVFSCSVTDAYLPMNCTSGEIHRLRINNFRFRQVTLQFIKDFLNSCLGRCPDDVPTGWDPIYSIAKCTLTNNVSIPWIYSIAKCTLTNNVSQFHGLSTVLDPLYSIAKCVLWQGTSTVPVSIPVPVPVPIGT